MIKMIKKIDKWLEKNYKIMAIISGILSILMIIKGIIKMLNRY
jgi:hypothetical protein